MEWFSFFNAFHRFMFYHRSCQQSPSVSVSLCVFVTNCVSMCDSHRVSEDCERLLQFKNSFKVVNFIYYSFRSFPSPFSSDQCQSTCFNHHDADSGFRIRNSIGRHLVSVFNASMWLVFKSEMPSVVFLSPAQVDQVRSILEKHRNAKFMSWRWGVKVMAELGSQEKDYV